MDLLNDGNGWEWRVDMRKQGEGPAQLGVLLLAS